MKRLLRWAEVADFIYLSKAVYQVLEILGSDLGRIKHHIRGQSLLN
jgi:hypothetical protein